MNFLAHLYLSQGINQLMIGNFIGDYVKGKKYESYSPEIQKGIILHRKIDAYTDSHPIVKQSTARFKPCYNRYASVVIDVIYDHYLAKKWNQYSDITLNNYVDKVHAYLLKNYFSLPNRVKGFLPFLIKSRRLENYQHLWGIEKSLSIMANYSSLPDKTTCAIKVLTEQYDELQGEFESYFNELRKVVQKEINEF
ncbi:ACP phosphodiesterase [Plebeiibacterium sediminum]|uniref:ACP phosphodiesterase n=1 Tax=Plebeiibacterium sediminum TaxID=2992112 RepID=A0AAE3M154_9BACT|nr:ACP phosphodiesterase [Plebeiobacterium sediminum]MCW3784855.1 ACP phosphodiesterase [Plebeiobacterium sediminum]